MKRLAVAAAVSVMVLAGPAVAQRTSGAPPGSPDLSSKGPAGGAVPAAARPPAGVKDPLGDLLNADQMLAQGGGKFGELVRELLPAGQIQDAWQKAKPGAAVQFIAFDKTKEIKLRLRTGAHTLVVLPEWESVSSNEQIDIGSQEAVSVKVKPALGGNTLALFPAQAGRDSTVSVMGDSGTLYGFYLVVETPKSGAVPDAAVHITGRAPLHWDGPQRPGVAQLVAAAGGGRGGRDYLRDLPFEAKNLDFGFAMSGDSTIAPETVFSDGIFTYLHFGDRFDAVDLPVVHRVQDRIDTPVNTRIKGRTLIVETPVGEGLTLRNGRRTVCIRKSTLGTTPFEVRPAPVAAPIPLSGAERAAGAARGGSVYTDPNPVPDRS